MFGFREAKSSSLVGTFYDLKQTAGRQDTKMNMDKYGEIVTEFVRGGWNEGILQNLIAARPRFSPTRFARP